MNAEAYALKQEPTRIGYREDFGQIRSLLGSGEFIPYGVAEILGYCRKRSAAVRFARNEAAGNCLDASLKRVSRDGSIGIPLRSELKSLVCQYKNSSKKICHVAVHCRGDAAIDFRAVRQVIGERIGTCSRVSLLPQEQLLAEYQLKFGLVNPFLLAVRSDSGILQIFDNGLLKGDYVSDEMMTNAGDYTWAIAFQPKDMLAAVENHLVGDIIKEGVPR